MGARKSASKSDNQTGTTSVATLIFLEMQPRLLREMLHLALTQLLDSAEIIPFEAQDFSLNQFAAKSAGDATHWWVMTSESSKLPDKQVNAALAQNPTLQIAALSQDARSLQVYTADADGQVRQTTYTDFSLAQLIDIFQQGSV